MTTATQTAQDQAHALFAVFRRLNPELVDLELEKLHALAPQLGPAFIDEAIDFGRELLDLYIASPVKRAERDVLSDYHVSLERAARKMIEAGELPDVGEAVKSACVSLVPADHYTPLQWFQINSKSQLPADIVHAVDASQRRNQLVYSVLEPYFGFLMMLDRDRAFEWMLEICGDTDNPIDPDVARDLIRAWRTETDLPSSVIRQTKMWSDDAKAFRHWPSLVEEADRLLREQWFRAWVKRMPTETVQAKHLQLLFPFNNGTRMLRWLKRCIGQTGDAIDFFIFESAKLAGCPDEEAEMRRAALFRQLLWINEMIPPMLVLADLILTTPNGAFEFALSQFGFTPEHRKSWEDVLAKHCAEAVHRRFLNDMKIGRQPVDTIKMLSFGDEIFEAEVNAELDALTGQFDSMAQRDIIVARLTDMYASYREQPLLNTELGRRYRRLMQVLHEDNIKRLLTDEQWQAIEEASGPLRDLASIAAASRKYLSSRRAFNRTTEEVLAEEIVYVTDIRALRATYIQRELL